MKNSHVFYPLGKSIITHILRYKGLVEDPDCVFGAVKYYSFTLDALNLRHSRFLQRQGNVSDLHLSNYRNGTGCSCLTHDMIRVSSNLSGWNHHSYLLKKGFTPDVRVHPQGLLKQRIYIGLDRCCQEILGFLCSVRNESAFSVNDHIVNFLLVQCVYHSDLDG
jgi:hypothetical protein